MITITITIRMMILMIIMSVRTKMIIVMKITLFKLRHGQFIKM